MNCNAPSDRFCLNDKRSHLGAADLIRDFDEYLARGSRAHACRARSLLFFVRRFLEMFCLTAAPDWSFLRGKDLAAFAHREASS